MGFLGRVPRQDMLFLTLELRVILFSLFVKKEIRMTSSLKEDSKGFLTTYVRVRTIKEKKLMLLVTETNRGLAHDRMLRFSKTFYDVCCHGNQNPT